MKSTKKFNITKTQVERAKQEGIWRFTNKVLYGLCEKHPKHDKEEVTAAKIWLIGRTFAVSIEQRTKKQVETDCLLKKVAGELKTTKIDKYISRIQNDSRYIDKDKELILKVHKKLVDIFEKLTKRKKRSLASKYLHLHLPQSVFIYDQRAKTGFSVICPNYVTKRQKSKKFDDEYENFFLKMLELQEWIEEEFKMLLRPRELDRLLLTKSQQSKKAGK